MAEPLSAAFGATFRDFQVDGVPASGANKVAKGEARALGAKIDLKIAAAAVGDTAAVEDLMQPYVTEAAEASETSQAAARAANSAAELASASNWPRTPNKFLPEELELTSLDHFVVTGGTLSRVIASDGLPALQLDVPPSGSASVYRRFSYAGELNGGKVSTGVRILQCEAAPGGSLRHIQIYRAANLAQLGRQILTIAGAAGLAVFDSARAASVLADRTPTTLTVAVDWYLDLGNLSDSVNTRSLLFRDPLIAEGADAAYRPATPRPLGPVTDTMNALLAEANQAVVSAEAASALAFSAIPVDFFGDLTLVLSEFGVPPYTIGQDFSGAITVSYAETDEASAAGNKVEYWVDPVNGSDANNGLSVGAPKKTIGPILALSASNPKVIHLAPGIYYRDTSPAGVTYSHLQHMTLKPTSGRALLTTALAPSEVSWSASGAAWSTAAANVSNVFDASAPDYRGVPRRYTPVADLAAVQAKAGSWALVSGTVYVRCFDDRRPDNDILVNTKGGGFTVTPRSGKTVFFSDLGFLMASASSDCLRVSTQSGTTGYFTGVRCFFGDGGADALGVRNTTLTWLRECTAAYAKIDAISYTRVGHNLPMDAVELRCHAYEAGTGGAGSSNNCSTAHEGVRVLRLGGLYYGALGPVIADVNGCKSLNINTLAVRSLLASSAGAAGWYANDQAGSIVTSPAGRMWLIACAGGESLYDIGSDGQAAIYFRNWRGPAVTPSLAPSIAVTRV